MPGISGALLVYALGRIFPMLLIAASDCFGDQSGKKGRGALDDEDNYFSPATPWNGNQVEESDLKEYSVYRAQRKAAGRIIDGRTWEEIPGELGVRLVILTSYQNSRYE